MNERTVNVRLEFDAINVMRTVFAARVANSDEPLTVGIRFEHEDGVESDLGLVPIVMSDQVVWFPSAVVFVVAELAVITRGWPNPDARVEFGIE